MAFTTLNAFRFALFALHYYVASFIKSTVQQYFVAVKNQTTTTQSLSMVIHNNLHFQSCYLCDREVVYNGVKIPACCKSK